MIADRSVAEALSLTVLGCAILADMTSLMAGTYDTKDEGLIYLADGSWGRATEYCRCLQHDFVEPDRRCGSWGNPVGEPSAEWDDVSGKTVLRYMVTLKPILESHGYEVANHLFFGRSAGDDRMTTAARGGIPRFLASRCVGWAFISMTQRFVMLCWMCLTDGSGAVSSKPIEMQCFFGRVTRSPGHGATRWAMGMWLDL